MDLIVSIPEFLIFFTADGSKVVLLALSVLYIYDFVARSYALSPVYVEYCGFPANQLYYFK